MRPAFLLLFSLLALSSGAANAQVTASERAAMQVAQVDGQGAGAVDQAAPVTTGSGLPERSAPARSMRAYWHVFIAFAVVWLLLFGYAVTVGRRFGKLEEEVRRLRGTS